MFKRFQNVCHMPTGKRGRIEASRTYGFNGIKGLTEHKVKFWDKSVAWCNERDLMHAVVPGVRLRGIPSLPKPGGDAA